MSRRALFVGLTNIDYVYYLDAFPGENGKAKTTEYYRYIGGPACNAAITYSLLGGDATLVTAIGNSDESKNITEELASYGVKIINLAMDNTLPGMSSIVVTPDGNRTIISGQKVFKDIELSKVNLDDYDFALFDCNQVDISIPLLERIKCDVVLDAGSYKEYTDKFLSRANIVIASESFRDEEGRDIFNMPYPDIEKKAVTRGGGPILICNGELEVPQVECIDSLAAGDIFHGAFCYAYYEKGMQFEKALKYAAEVASESVTHIGPRIHNI